MRRRWRGVLTSALIAVLPLVGGLLVSGTDAAFTGSTVDGGNVFSAGSVTITDDLGATVLFNAADTPLRPLSVGGAALVRCVTVTYSGSVYRPVKMYGALLSDPDGLASHLRITVIRGNTATCGSVATIEQVVAADTVFSTFLSGTTSYATGAGNWLPSAGNTVRMYQITMKIISSPTPPVAVQGTTMTFSLSWEAQTA